MKKDIYKKSGEMLSERPEKQCYIINKIIGKGISTLFEYEKN